MDGSKYEGKYKDDQKDGILLIQASASSHGPTALASKAILPIIISMVRAPIAGPTKGNSPANGRTIRCMALEFSPGATAEGKTK